MWSRNAIIVPNRQFGGHFEKAPVKNSARHCQSGINWILDLVPLEVGNHQKNKVFRVLHGSPYQCLDYNRQITHTKLTIRMTM